MRDSIEAGIMFNIIDGSQGVKADLVPLSREPAYREAFSRRVRCVVVDPQGREFEIWCARPEDIVVGKLMAWQRGRSARHPSDIYAVLAFQLGAPGAGDFDTGYVSAKAAAIGEEAEDLWQTLLARVRRELADDTPLF